MQALQRKQPKPFATRTREHFQLAARFASVNRELEHAIRLSDISYWDIRILQRFNDRTDNAAVVDQRERFWIRRLQTNRVVCGMNIQVRCVQRSMNVSRRNYLAFFCVGDMQFFHLFTGKANGSYT